MAQQQAPIYHPGSAEDTPSRSIAFPFEAGLSLGNWFGIRVRADFSVLLVFTLIPVIENGGLRGLVRRQDLVRWLGLRLQTRMV